MNKFSLTAIAIAFASTAAFAQAPQSTAQEANANKSGGVASDKAQARTDMKKDGTPMTSAMGSSTTMASGNLSPRMKMMDTNGDGMVSQAEWNAYHSGMWKKMKKNKGMATAADVEASLVGGPN